MKSWICSHFFLLSLYLLSGCWMYAKDSSGRIYQGGILIWSEQCDLRMEKYKHWETLNTLPRTEFAAAISEDRKKLFLAAKCFFDSPAPNCPDLLEVRFKTSQNRKITIKINSTGSLSGEFIPAETANTTSLQIQARVKTCSDHWETEMCLNIAELHQKPDWFPAWEMQIVRRKHSASYQFVISKLDFSGQEMNPFYCVVRRLPGATDNKNYLIRKGKQPIDLEQGWDSPAWKEIPSISLHYEHWKPGLSGTFIPKVSVKMQHRQEMIYVMYKVEDCFIRGNFKKDQGPVCFDSAAELFLQPAGSDAYYNLEANCIGAILFYKNIINNEGKISVPVDMAVLKKIERKSSLPQDMKGEITTPTTWYLTLRIPKEAFLPEQKEIPLSGQIWRGNIYKCSDKTSNPCWLAWAECNTFHEPEAFGTFRFE